MFAAPFSPLPGSLNRRGGRVSLLPVHVLQKKRSIPHTKKPPTLSPHHLSHSLSQLLPTHLHTPYPPHTPGHLIHHPHSLPPRSHITPTPPLTPIPSLTLTLLLSLTPSTCRPTSPSTARATTSRDTRDGSRPSTLGCTRTTTHSYRLMCSFRYPHTT